MKTSSNSNTAGKEFRGRPKYAKRLIALGLLATAIVLPNAVRANEAAYKKLLPSTVWIRDPGFSRGSGVLVNAERRWVVTNYHVVQEKEQVRVYFPVRKDGRTIMEEKFYMDNESALGINGRVIARIPGKDLALVELERLPKAARAVKFASKGAAPGQTLHVIANQVGIGALWIYTYGKVRTVLNRKMRMRIGARTIALDVRFVVTDLPVNPGDSGGPVVNDDGELVALVSNGDMQKRLITYTIALSEIRAFLKQAADGSLARQAEDGDINPLDLIRSIQQGNVKPQAPEKKVSLVGAWTAKMELPNEVTGKIGLALNKNGRFDLAADWSDGKKVHKVGGWRLQNGRLTLTVAGKVILAGRVIAAGENGFTLDDGADRVRFTRTQGSAG